MSALDEIILSKKYGQSYTPLESVLMVHKKRYPNDAATAAAELLALRERVAKLENQLKGAQKMAVYFYKLGHGVRPSLGAMRLVRAYEAALKSQ